MEIMHMDYSQFVCMCIILPQCHTGLAQSCRKTARPTLIATLDLSVGKKLLNTLLAYYKAFIIREYTDA